jgi:signal transduction histidine kinase
VRRRLVASNLVLVTVVLLLLEVPLGIVYSRHEHDALIAALQRDASSLGALSEEIIEHPGTHDVNALALNFAKSVGGQVVIVDRTGAALASRGSEAADQAFRAALLSARAGRGGSGEIDGLAYATVTVGSVGDAHGAVLVARDDKAVDGRVHQLWFLLLVIGFGALAVSAFVSHQLAGWVVGPLQRLDVTAANLGAGDLTVRADTDAGPPEVIALAETFNRMADRLDALLASQRRFVADASHQLRTPLTALRLRLENIDPVDTGALSATRDAALAEAGRLSRLVDGLLALARAEGQVPRRELIDVSAVLVERFNAWKPLADEHGVDLRILEADRSPSAVMVPGHLDQILDNLMDNALDATPSGRAVRIGADVVGATVEIHVTDEGRGMTDVERNRAFDPFWRGPHQDSRTSTGLGLAIVDQLVRANDGTVGLERTPTGGIDAVVRVALVTG